MKKIAASVGLVAIGASALHGAYAPGLSEMETTKAWSVSATLRGFYDDNIYTSKSDEVDSVGFEISPSFGYNFVGDQTLLGLGYTYSGKYYDEARGGFDHWSHVHSFDAGLQHAFNPRASINVRNSFVMGDEPDQLRAGDAQSSFQRLSSNDNMRNYAQIAGNYQATPLLGFEAGYGNQYWNYDEDGVGSQSAVLDRLEHDPYIDSRWNIAPQTVGILGGRFHQTSYTGDEIVSPGGFIPVPPFFVPDVMSDDRDYRSYYGYGGVEHTFRPDLSAWINAGIRYTDYYNSADEQTDTAPYVRLGVNYRHSKDSTFGLTYSYDLSSTDLTGTAGDPIRGMDSSVVSAWFTHQLMPSLYLRVQGTFQYSTFEGGGAAFDGESEQYYTAGVNLEYRFNRHFSAHLGYSFDKLDSDLGDRGFDRNRVYTGVTATY